MCRHYPTLHSALDCIATEQRRDQARTVTGAELDWLMCRANCDQERRRLCFCSNTDADVSRLDIGVISQFLWAAVENDASLIQDTNVVGDFEGDRQLLHDDQDA